MKILKIKFIVENLKDWLLRGFFGSIAMVAFYLSISITSSGRAVMLNDTYPIFVALFGYLFFKERIYKNDIVGLFLCLIGIFFIFYERESYSVVGDILGLISGISSGFAIHYVKRSTMTNHPVIVYFSACIVGLLFIPFSFTDKVDVSMISIILVIIVGVLTFFAQLFMSYGYKYVSATKGSIIIYMQIPIVLLLSFLILNEIFKPKFIIGTVFIIVGLLVSAFLNKITKKKAS